VNAGDPRPMQGSRKFPFRKSRADSAISRLHFRRTSILNVGIKTFFGVSRRVVPLIGPPEKLSSVQLFAVIPPHNIPSGALLYFSNIRYSWDFPVSGKPHFSLRLCGNSHTPLHEDVMTEE
jgi:hypothetical protein